MKNEHYVYIYLDPRYPGRWEYKDWVFLYQPFYVGIGKNERILSHLKKQELSRNTNKARRTKAIIEECGSPFYFKISESLDKFSAADEEVLIIKKFGRVDIGTGILDNLTDGGLGVPKYKLTENTREKMKKSSIGVNAYNSKCVLQFDLDGNFIKKWDFLTQAADFLGKFPANISAVCRGRQKTAYGFIWKYDGTTLYKPREKSKRGTTVFQYSYFGDFLMEYDSLGIAAEEWGISQSGIWQCLCGNNYHTGGFQWKLEYQGEKIPQAQEQERPFKKVFQYKDGIFVKEFSSITEAAKSINIDPGAISSACRDPFSLMSMGYQWSLVFYESLPLIPTHTQKPIMKLDSNMNLVQEYSSAAEVKIDVQAQTIVKWARNGAFERGYFWNFSENRPELSRFTFKPKKKAT